MSLLIAAKLYYIEYHGSFYINFNIQWILLLALYPCFSTCFSWIHVRLIAATYLFPTFLNNLVNSVYQLLQSLCAFIPLHIRSPISLAVPQLCVSCLQRATIPWPSCPASTVTTTGVTHHRRWTGYQWTQPWSYWHPRSVWCNLKCNVHV